MNNTKRAIIETAARLIRINIKSIIPPVTDYYTKADGLKTLTLTVMSMLQHLFMTAGA